MHPIITYELVKTRMEEDRQSERCRLAQAEMPQVLRASARRPRPQQRLRNAIRRMRPSVPVTEGNTPAEGCIAQPGGLRLQSAIAERGSPYLSAFPRAVPWSVTRDGRAFQQGRSTHGGASRYLQHPPWRHQCTQQSIRKS